MKKRTHKEFWKKTKKALYSQIEKKVQNNCLNLQTQNIKHFNIALFIYIYDILTDIHIIIIIIINFKSNIFKHKHSEL